MKSQVMLRGLISHLGVVPTEPMHLEHTALAILLDIDVLLTVQCTHSFEAFQFVLGANSSEKVMPTHFR